MALPTRYPRNQGQSSSRLRSLVGQVRDVATTPVGGGPRLPMAQPQSFAAPQQFANSRSPSMAMPIGGQSVTPAPNYDPAVWGPGGRQYPTVTPASQGGGQQPLSVAPRYGQSGQQAAMSLQNAQQQARDFTNQGVDRIFATNGGPVTTNSSFTGPPNPSSPVAQSMPYGSGSTLIRTADGRTILAGNRIAPGDTESAAQKFATSMRENSGVIPQNEYGDIQRASSKNSLLSDGQMNKQRLADMKAQDTAARDRQIVSNAMRFGVRNPLAIEAAQRMGIRLPGMPRVSGDATMAGSAEPTTAQINASLIRAQQNPVYADIQAGFDPGAAQGSQWAAMLQQPNVQKMTTSEVNRVKQELRDATKSKTYRSTATDAEVIDAFLSGGPQAVSNLIQSRQAAGQPYGVPNFNQGSGNVARGRIGM